jgi:transposase
VPKTAATSILTKLDLERLYAEIESRVGKKFETRIRSLEKEIERLKEDRDAWQNRYFKEQETSRRLSEELKSARSEIVQLKTIVEKQNSRIKALEKQLHGKKTEVTKVAPEAGEDRPPKRSKGRQLGAKGHGRKLRIELEPVECVHDFAPGERICGDCGEPFSDMGEQVSEEIDVEYKLVRLVHKRKKIRKSCQCAGTSVIKVAPGPPKLFSGSLFTTNFWAYLIFEKFQLQRPTNRVRQLWSAHGLNVSQGTITNGLKRLHVREVFKPLAEAIRARVKAGTRQKSDETGWKVFQKLEGKEGYQHWLWVTLGVDACVFRVEPYRSKEMAKKMIPDHPVILSSDRLSSYHNLGENVTNSWCWAHIRREFLALLSSDLTKPLGQRWVAKVDKLYHLNNCRLANRGRDFDRFDAELRLEILEFERQLKRNATRKGMPAETRSLFKNIAKDWPGLIVFVDLPEISMDNNASEQALRNSVCGRKAYYGSGSQWSADLTADLFTILTTLDMNGLNPVQWLKEYLLAVAKSGGKAPSNATDFLPWNTPPVHFLSE